MGYQLRPLSVICSIISAREDDMGRLTSLWIGDTVINRNSNDCLLLVSK